MSKCGACGGEFKQTVIENFTGPWKWYKEVVVTEPLTLRTCQGCGDYLISSKDSQMIDQAVIRSLKKLGLRYE